MGFVLHLRRIVDKLFLGRFDRWNENDMDGKKNVDVSDKDILVFLRKFKRVGLE